LRGLLEDRIGILHSPVLGVWSEIKSGILNNQSLLSDHDVKIMHPGNILHIDFHHLDSTTDGGCGN